MESRLESGLLWNYHSHAPSFTCTLDHVTQTVITENGERRSPLPIPNAHHRFVGQKKKGA